MAVNGFMTLIIQLPPFDYQANKATCRGSESASGTSPHVDSPYGVALGLRRRGAKHAGIGTE